jgi:hypothetical protein
MAKKKAPPLASEAKEDTTLIRVSVRFANAIRDAAVIEKTSVANLADAHLLPVVEKRYRDFILREAKRMEGRE